MVVIGGALAGAVALAVVGVLGWTFYVRHQRKRESDQEVDDDTFMPSSVHHGDTYVRSFVPVSEGRFLLDICLFFFFSSSGKKKKKTTDLT